MSLMPILSSYFQILTLTTLHFIYKSRESKVLVSELDSTIYQKLNQFDDEADTDDDDDEEEEEFNWTFGTRVKLQKNSKTIF